MIRGKDFIFYILINGTPQPFLHATDCTLKTNAELLESTTKNGLRGKTFEYAGKYSYTISISGQSVLLDPTNFYTLQTALQTANKLIFTFTDNSQVTYSGTVLIYDTEIDSPHDAISHFKGEFQGDGEYTSSANVGPTPPIGYAVQITDQFGNLVANVPAPGVYNVLRFNEIYDDLLQSNDTVITDQLI